MTSIQSRCLIDSLDLKVLSVSSPLSLLHNLELQGMYEIDILPPLDSLTAQQSLKLINCKRLREFPPLNTLTALQAL
jgi:hypothetical protein